MDCHVSLRSIAGKVNQATSDMTSSLPTSPCPTVQSYVGILSECSSVIENSMLQIWRVIYLSVEDVSHIPNSGESKRKGHVYTALIIRRTHA